MKQAENYLPSSASSSKPVATLNRKRGDALWVALAGMFGSKLTSQYGEQCPMVWHRMIADLEDSELSRGIRWLKDEGREWPPSAPEFWRLCKKTEPPRPLPFKSLPAPPADKAKAKPHIDACRKALGMPVK